MQTVNKENSNVHNKFQDGIKDVVQLTKAKGPKEKMQAKAFAP